MRSPPKTLANRGNRRLSIAKAAPRLAVAALVFAIAMSIGAAAIAASAACWSDEDLSAKPGEDKAHRSSESIEPEVQVAHANAAGLGVVRRVRLADGDRRVALTFDLCETSREVAGYDGRIVDLLRASGVKATFFAGGHWMRTHPERAAQILADPLFELGQHSWSHKNLVGLTDDERRREIDGASAEAAHVRGELLARPCAAGASIPPLKYFRYPFGDCDDAAQAAVADTGLVAIQWDVVPGDPSPGQSSRAIARAMVDGARPGSIVVLHANGRGRHTAEALALAIPALRERGFSFATVSELIAAGEPEVDMRCYVNRPGDTLRYRRRGIR